MSSERFAFNPAEAISRMNEENQLFVVKNNMISEAERIAQAGDHTVRLHRRVRFQKQNASDLTIVYFLNFDRSNYLLKPVAAHVVPQNPNVSNVKIFFNRGGLMMQESVDSEHFQERLQAAVERTDFVPDRAFDEIYRIKGRESVAFGPFGLISTQRIF